MGSAEMMKAAPLVLETVDLASVFAETQCANPARLAQTALKTAEFVPEFAAMASVRVERHVNPVLATVAHVLRSAEMESAKQTKHATRAPPIAVREAVAVAKAVALRR